MYRYGGSCMGVVVMGLAIAGISIPLFYYSKVELKGQKFEMAVGLAGTSSKMGDAHDGEYKTTISESCDGSDNEKKCCNAMKAGFSFVIIGAVIQLIQIFAFLVPAMLPAMAPLALSIGVSLCYLIAWATPVGACGDLVDDANKLAYVDMELSIAFILLVVAWVLSLVNCALGFMVMKEGPAEEDKTVIAAVATPMDEPATEVPPPGGVYIKNGIWMDDQGRPVDDKSHPGIQ